MGHESSEVRKSFAAYFALIRFLTSMRPLVGDEIRQLRETFLTLLAFVDVMIS